MSRALWAFVSLVALALAGCRDPDGPVVGGDFPGRLTAAKAISNSIQRDEALAKLAVDAGAHGEGDIVKQALGAISNTLKKDEAAAKAALRLARTEKGEDAAAVAKLINNSLKRDETLAKLAKGDLSD